MPTHMCHLHVPPLLVSDGIRHGLGVVPIVHRVLKHLDSHAGVIDVLLFLWREGQHHGHLPLIAADGLPESVPPFLFRLLDAGVDAREQASALLPRGLVRRPCLEDAGGFDGVDDELLSEIPLALAHVHLEVLQPLLLLVLLSILDSHYLSLLLFRHRERQSLCPFGHLGLHVVGLPLDAACLLLLIAQRVPTEDGLHLEGGYGHVLGLPGL
mmetsp:Transcript_840/g.1747  ORF Transcript_840/g.1747 Transcript_840/m.1747 type:complete len:212 (+) Transcript_840:451-1086(+)